MSKPLLAIRKLKKRYGNREVLCNLNFDIQQGEIFGLVGESGSGKSTLAKSIVRLLKPTSGSIEYEGIDLTSISKKQLKAFRREIQIVFQDPYASLNPRMTIAEAIGEALDIHKLAKGEKRRHRIHQLLQMVGLPPDCSSRFPHEFSGGQRQRLCIARALATNPKVLILDEPVSALDLSIQAQVVGLLRTLQKEMQLTYLFIAHDLALVRHLCDTVAVMYKGKIVELAPTEQLYSNPQHAYTQHLLSAMLTLPRVEEPELTTR